MAELPQMLRASLAGRYDVERELGEGGMATVYLAEDVRHGRKVAIKVMRPEVAASLGLERFLAEIKLTASLQHPHILALLDSGVIDAGGGVSRPFYVMPYVTGETLRARIVRDGALPVNEAVGILAEMADALSSAHASGIVHRDIKPENILLGQGHAMVTDFGIAKAVHRSIDGSNMTNTGVSLGTPAYMSPEQAVGDPQIDHRADLYALGLVAFELLAGRTPFANANIASMVTASLTQRAPSLATVRPATPPRLVELVAALLEKDPAARPQTAASVRDTLRSILAELSASQPVAQRPAATRRVMLGVLAAATIIIAAGIAVWQPWRSTLGASSPAAVSPEPPVTRSIAVLPFRNVNRDSTTDYFSDGIAEELISALGRLKGLRVASRTSTFAMKAQSDVLAEVGKRLGVGVVLEGSVRRDADQVRVNARLVDVASDSVLWDGEYTNQLRNVLFVQDSIARAIVTALRGTLTGEPAIGLSRPRTGDPAAYDAYLHGRHFLAQRTAASIGLAIKSFEEAIRHDSTFAPAWAGLADAYSLAAPFAGRRPGDVFERARSAAKRALSLDPSVAEAHTSLGIVAMFYDWDWAAAQEHLRRGVELNPSYAEGHLFYAWYQLFRGKEELADSEIARAYNLDQLSVVIATRRGTILQYRGHDAEAIRYFRQALELDSTFYFARVGLAVSYVQIGQPDSARRVVPRETSTGNGEAGLPGWVLSKLGDTATVRQQLKALEAAERRGYVAADGMAGVYAVLGDSARALDLLEKAADERAFTLIFLARYPMFESLHGSERYKRLIAKVGVLPP